VLLFTQSQSGNDADIQPLLEAKEEKVDGEDVQLLRQLVHISYDIAGGGGCGPSNLEPAADGQVGAKQDRNSDGGKMDEEVPPEVIKSVQERCQKTGIVFNDQVKVFKVQGRELTRVVEVSCKELIATGIRAPVTPKSEADPNAACLKNEDLQDKSMDMELLNNHSWIASFHKSLCNICFSGLGFGM